MVGSQSLKLRVKVRLLLPELARQCGVHTFGGRLTVGRLALTQVMKVRSLLPELNGVEEAGNPRALGARVTGFDSPGADWQERRPEGGG